MKLAMVLALVTGCGAAQSALGALTSGGPKVTVTVNNNVAAAPAPAETLDDHTTRDVATAGAAGAAVGALAGYMVDGSTKAVAGGAIAGAGVGTLVGYVAAKL